MTRLTDILHSQWSRGAMLGLLLLFTLALQVPWNDSRDNLENFQKYQYENETAIDNLQVFDKIYKELLRLSNTNEKCVLSREELQDFILSGSNGITFHNADCVPDGKGILDRLRTEMYGSRDERCKYMFKSKRIGDVSPFLFINNSTGEKAIICLAPKVGSTMWKQLLAKGEGLKITGLVNPHHLGREFPKQFPNPSQFYLSLINTPTRRYIFARNPFSRFLSAYLDKVENRELDLYYPSGFRFYAGVNESKVDRFRRFVKAYTSTTNNRRNAHFLPITSQCNIFNGMHYDVVLKVEDMDFWYEEFITELGLNRAASSGWNKSTEWISGDSPRFYTLKKKKCSIPVMPNTKQEDYGGEDKKLANPRSFHATRSVDKVNKYYDEDSFERVREFSLLDFAFLGYPVEWRDAKGHSV